MKNFISGSQKIGQLGESVACKFLMKQGYSILERNYTKKWGEIDIIAQKGDRLFFVEVKSKSVSNLDFVLSKIGNNTNPIRPEDNMHPFKLKRLSRVVQTYLIHNRIGNTPWQFDLLIVYLDLELKKAKVRKIENIIL